MSGDRRLDVVVIGGGQAGLACGYYLRRTGLSHVIVDSQEEPGGAWQNAWDALRLFSPARYSSLPGWLMPGGTDDYPTKDDVLDYLEKYERRYGLPVERPVRVRAVTHGESGLRVETDRGSWLASAVVSATGSWEEPDVPSYPGQDEFEGEVLHSADYRSPEPFRGKRVLVVGAGNSGAQILSELSLLADTTWVTLEEPTFLPPDVDGRYLFEQSTALYKARKEGREEPPQASLADIVRVEPVREAEARGALVSVRPFLSFTRKGIIWSDGREERIDVVIWCTGFRPALGHLAPLDVIEGNGRVSVRGTRSVREPRLWLVGYGNWTGFASATLIGVGRSARATVEEIVRVLQGEDPS